MHGTCLCQARHEGGPQPCQWSSTAPPPKGSCSQLDNCGARPSFIAQPAAASQLLTTLTKKDGLYVVSTSTILQLHTYGRGQNDQNISSKELSSNIYNSRHIVAAVCTRLHPSTAGAILFLNWIIGAHIAHGSGAQTAQSPARAARGHTSQLASSQQLETEIHTKVRHHGEGPYQT